MSVSISNHSLLTTAAAASTTGTLTASAGDLAICTMFTSTGTTIIPASVTGGGLTWVLVYDQTLSVNHTVIYIAPVYATVTAQTITASITNATSIKGMLLAIKNGRRIGTPSIGSSLGTTTVTRTIVTTNNDSLVVGMFAGTTDTLITTPATVLDNNGANLASATAGGPFTSGNSTNITATSVSGALGPSVAFEITAANYKRINSGLRPHPFSPGLAR